MSGFKLKVMPQFPANVVGGVGIGVTKANGIFTLDFDYSDFPPLSAIPPPDVPNLYSLLYNIFTGKFELVQISLLGGGGGSGGIAEAPNDGFSYGRNASAWTRVLALNGGTLTGSLLLSADPSVALGAATKQYVDAHAFTDAAIDSNTYGRNNGAWAKVLNLAGGTMTGTITLASDPAGPLQAATKQYADVHPFADAATDGFYYARLNGAWAKVLGLAGGTMTGTLVLAGDPTVAAQAATKNYVDNAVAGGGGGGGIPDAPKDGTTYGRNNALWVNVLALAGGSMTGALLLQGDPTTALGAATKQYVDSHGGLVDAPNDGSAYGRQSGVWANVLPLAGGTLTGPLLLAADPSVALGTATKQYVDAHSFVDAPNDGSTYGRKSLGWSKALDLTGGTLTGPLILNADPSVPLGAATKQYADGKVAKSGDTMTGALAVNGNISSVNTPTTGSYYFGSGGTKNLNYDGTQFNLVGGPLFAPGLVAVGDLWARGSATTGNLYFGSSSSKYLNYDGTNFNLVGGALNVPNLNATGPIATSNGFSVRQGTGGPFKNNVHNIDYGGGTAVGVYIDATYMGNITWTSDYRIKKDVIDLPSMWETTKKLRPISYTQAEFSPPSHLAHVTKMKVDDQPAKVPLFVADNIERWGFIAHELQEATITSVATGEKDSPDIIQSPNAWVLIAALTKTLQEAMARIEALEARLG